MRDSVSARGYTSLILVLDMRQFVAPSHRQQFERIRGTRPFAQVLRTAWAEQLAGSGTFSPCDTSPDNGRRDHRTSSEEIGFISGIFRSNMLEEYTTPTYLLHKDRISFAEPVMQNLQFKELFADVWRRWEIYVRPTVTGMLMVRLTRRYDKATPIITVASDVVKVQMVFDIPGALQRLRELDGGTSEPPEIVRGKQTSIREFLKWLGSDPDADTRPDYVPVQWKLAMEVCQRLVHDVGLTIPLADGAIPLHVPDRTTSTPLHDSYVMYHIDELTALEFVVQKARQEAVLATGDAQSNGSAALPSFGSADDRHQVLVTPEDVRHSGEIQRNLIHLIEGSILEKVRSRSSTSKTGARDGGGKSRRATRYFPTHRPGYVSGILTQDRATWNDEICLLAPRAAVIIPSRRASQDALFISNFSATTGQVMYAWYWEAMERMVEFIIEIRVLAQLMERSSAEVLQQFVQALSTLRSGLLRRDGRMDYQMLTPLIDQVANLSRMVGLCQGLSNPSVWSRAEYAVEKARHLMEQQDVPLLLEHTERNVNNLTSLLDHADELYLAALSERTNQETFWLSLVLAGLSLSITLFALPSFWADLAQLSSGAAGEPTQGRIIPWIAIIGDILAPVLIFGSLVIALTATYRFMSFRTRQQRMLSLRRRKRLRADGV